MYFLLRIGQACRPGDLDDLLSQNIGQVCIDHQGTGLQIILFRVITFNTSLKKSSRMARLVYAYTFMVLSKFTRNRVEYGYYSYTPGNLCILYSPAKGGMYSSRAQQNTLAQES